MKTIASKAVSPGLAWLVLLASHAAALGQNDNDTQNAAKAAVIACQANLDSFVSYKCRFILSKAGADSVEKALKGDLTNSDTCDFLLVVDKSREKFQCLAEAPKLPKGARPTRGSVVKVSSHFAPFVDLKQSDWVLQYYAPWNSAEVRQATRYRESPFSSPLYMDYLTRGNPLSPTRLLQEYERGIGTIGSEGTKVVDGATTIHVNFKSGLMNLDYYIDPARGYLPVKIVSHVKPPVAKQEMDIVRSLMAAKDFGKNRWFPMNTIKYSLIPGREHLAVDVVEVKELEVDKKLSEDDFAVELPAGTKIESAREDASHSQFRLKQNEKINPDQLPRLAKMLEKTQEAPLMDTAVAPRSSGSAKWFMMGGGLLSLAGASCYVYLRRRSRAAA